MLKMAIDFALHGWCKKFISKKRRPIRKALAGKK
jgi:hypothetical protein